MTYYQYFKSVEVQTLTDFSNYGMYAPLPLRDLISNKPHSFQNYLPQRQTESKQWT